MIKNQKVATIYSSGQCNLNCSYCYNPKLGNKMVGVNKQIINWISSGKMLEDLIYLFGENLEAITFWGGEPSLNLPYFGKELEDIFKTFPKLNKIFFSTNISTKKIVENIKDFSLEVKRLNKLFNREVFLEMQFSLDGPPEYNDETRLGSSANKIVSNITDLLSFFKKESFLENEIGFHGKGTFPIPTLKKFYDGDNLVKYWKWYDEAYSEWNSISYKYPRMEAITYPFPGQYNKDDGLFFAEFLKKFYIESKKVKLKNYSNPKEQVYFKTSAMFNQLGMSSKRNFYGQLVKSSSCSVGGGDIGLSYDGNFHICQGTFFLDEEVTKEIKEKKLSFDFEENQGYSFNNFNTYVKDKWVFPYRDELRLYRNLDLLDKYINGMEFKENTARTLIQRNAISGFIDKKYEREGHNLSLFAGIMTLGGYSCVANSLLEFGNIWTPATSVIKLLGNGAIEVVLNQLKEDGVNYGI